MQSITPERTEISPALGLLISLPDDTSGLGENFPVLTTSFADFKIQNEENGGNQTV